MEGVGSFLPWDEYMAIEKMPFEMEDLFAPDETVSDVCNSGVESVSEGQEIPEIDRMVEAATVIQQFIGEPFYKIDGMHSFYAREFYVYDNRGWIEDIANSILAGVFERTERERLALDSFEWVALDYTIKEKQWFFDSLLALEGRKLGNLAYDECFSLNWYETLSTTELVSRFEIERRILLLTFNSFCDGDVTVKTIAQLTIASIRSSYYLRALTCYGEELIEQRGRFFGFMRTLFFSDRFIQVYNSFIGQRTPSDLLGFCFVWDNDDMNPEESLPFGFLRSLYFLHENMKSIVMRGYGRDSICDSRQFAIDMARVTSQMFSAANDIQRLQCSQEMRLEMCFWKMIAFMNRLLIPDNFLTDMRE